MRWTSGCRQVDYAFTVSGGWIFTMSARAAEMLNQPGDIPVFTWLWVAGISVMGWGASSLPLLAGWVDGTMLDRLRIVQGIVIATAAGALAFIIEISLVNKITMLGFVGSFFAAYAGDHYLRKKAELIMDIIKARNSTEKT
jgi:hypothetical protein